MQKHLLFFVVFLLLGLPYVSHTQGNYWELTGGPHAGSIFSLTATPDGFLFTRTLNGTFRSDDDGDSWVEIPLGQIDQNAWIASRDTAGRMYAMSSSTMYRSTDNGDTWVELGRQGFSLLSFSTLIVMNDSLLFARSSDEFYHSTDDGISWAKISNAQTPMNLTSVFQGPNNNLYAMDWNKILYKSVDFGVTWENFIQFSGAISPRGFHFVNDSTLYITTENLPSVSILFSNNFGATWTTVHDFGINAANTGFIRDTSGNWFMSFTSISSLAQNGGVYRSSDHGATWQLEIGGLDYRNVQGIALGLSGYLFAGTLGPQGGNIYRSLKLVTSLADVDESEPRTFVLAQNYPNPFNPTTVIRYQLPVDTKVSLRVYDLLGRLVETLVESRQGAGEYRVNWTARSVPAGVYFYHLDAGSVVEIRKMILLK